MKDDLNKAASILKKGGVIAYPTDTVYGLGADAFNEEAVRRIYRIKQRPLSQPFPILIAEKSDLNSIAEDISEIGCLLMERFWPGGLTLVVRKSAGVPLWVTAGGNTVAVRIPNHPLTLKLIRGLGKPLVGTSANLSGSPSAITADEVHTQLGDSIDFILDGGSCPGGIESTVVDVTGDIPVVLREGAISGEMIAGVCGLPRRRSGN